MVDRRVVFIFLPFASASIHLFTVEAVAHLGSSRPFHLLDLIFIKVLRLLCPNLTDASRREDTREHFDVGCQS